MSFDFKKLASSFNLISPFSVFFIKFSGDNLFNPDNLGKISQTSKIFLFNKSKLIFLESIIIFFLIFVLFLNITSISIKFELIISPSPLYKI